MVKEGVCRPFYAGCRKTEESRGISYKMQVRVVEALNFGSARENGREGRKETKETLARWKEKIYLHLSTSNSSVGIGQGGNNWKWKRE